MYDASLLRNVTSSESPLLYVSGPEVREALELDRTQFIDFALLLGSDFSPRLHGLGPARAIKLLRSNGSIEAIIRSERLKPGGRRFLPEPKLSEAEYLRQVETGRTIFRDVCPISDEMKAQLWNRRKHNAKDVADVLAAFDLYADSWLLEEGDSGVNPLQTDYFGKQTLFE